MHGEVWRRWRGLDGTDGVLRLRTSRLNLQASVQFQEGRPVLSLCGSNEGGAQNPSPCSQALLAHCKFHFLLKTPSMTLEVAFQGPQWWVSLRVDFGCFLASLNYVHR